MMALGTKVSIEQKKKTKEKIRRDQFKRGETAQQLRKIFLTSSSCLAISSLHLNRKKEKRIRRDQFRRGETA